MKVQRIESTFNGNTAFTENIEYSDTVPYSLIVKEISGREITPLYQCPTLELLLLFDVTGSLFYGLQSLPVQGNQAFLIPPNIVHNTDLLCEHSRKIVIEFSLEHMNRYINLDRVLSLQELSLHDLNTVYTDEFEQIYACIQNLVIYDGNFVKCFSEILKLFDIMTASTLKERKPLSLDYSKAAVFQKLINWTIINISSPITNADASRITGLTETYFCRYFKQITGMTYGEYLQYLRINYAQTLLAEGKSVSECSYECGYSNISYFIRVFRKHTGMTMLQYRKKFFEKS